MRSSIRTKMLLLVLIPIVIIYWCVVIVNNHYVRQDAIEALETRLAEITWHMADQYDGRLREAAQIARSTASFIESAQNLNEQEIFAQLRANLIQNEAIYGSGVAFSPFRFNSKTRLFCPYVFRGPGELEAMDIGTEGYDYTEPQWAWWNEPKRSGSAVWSEPYFDEGAGNISMSTFSAPFFREGSFSGVATVDLPLDHLNELVSRDIDRFFRILILDGDGDLIFGEAAEPGPHPSSGSGAASRPDSELKALTATILRPGVSKERYEGDNFWIGSARIESTGWTVAAMIEEELVLQRVHSHLSRSLVLFAVSLLMIIVVIWYISARLTAPIRQFTDTITQVGNGHLEADLAISSRDEVGDLALSFSKMTLKLRQREKDLVRMSKVFMDGADPIIIEDLKGIVVDLNDEAVRTYGWSRQELIGNPIKTIVPPDRHQQADTLLKRCLEGDSLRAVEGLRMAKDGTVFDVLITLSLLRDPEGNRRGVATITKDISELKRVERELQESNRLLEKRVAERTRELEIAKNEADAANESKSNFLANMSHEIRTPMNAVIGMAHLLTRTDLSSKQQDYTRKIHTAAHNLLGIINDILDFSKVEAGKLEIEETQFNLDEVLLSVSDLASVKAEEKGLELVFRKSKMVPIHLVGDPLRLAQILTNLVNNSIKFTEAGEVVVTTELLEETGEAVRLQFSIQDTGIGMTEVQIANLFQAFSQADTSTTRKYGGTGLGLTISRQLVELMGGEIHVESQPGRGSIFHFTGQFGRHSGERRRYRLPTADLKGLRVLVVDDNESARAALQDYLEDFSFSPTTVASGGEAVAELKTAETAGDPYSVVLMDWMMPEMTGIETAQCIQRELTPTSMPKIVMVTAYGREEVIKQAEDASLDGFLVKPVSQSVLFETILEALGERLETEKHPEQYAPEMPEGFEAIRGARVLLVEDNEINQQVATEMLEAEGFWITTATNGIDAVNKVRSTETQGEFDVILMDLQMPLMNGYEATQEIRVTKEPDQLPIIAMTADAVTGVKQKCLEAGMNDYVTKPVEPKDLYQALARWIKPGERQCFVSGESESLESEAAMPHLPGVNTEDGLRRVAGNTALYRKLISEFGRRHRQFTQEFERAYSAGELELAIRQAHTLSGVSANLGAETLHREARKLETALKEAVPARIEIALSNVKQALGALVDRIAQWEESNREDGGHRASATELEPEELLERISALEQLLSNSDPEAEEHLDEIRATLEARGNADEGRRMKLLLSNFDFDSALEIAVRLRKSLV